MKLNKLLPLVALFFAVTASSAFAVGKDSADHSGDTMCYKLEGAMIKADNKDHTPVVTPAATVEQKQEPANNTTAM